MSLTRIRAMLLQEYYITRRSLEVIFDLYVFSSAGILAFGLLTTFLRGGTGGPSAFYLLLGLTLWEVVRVAQYSMSVSSLWNVWSHNLSNIFVSPLSLTEYLVAQFISSILKAASVVAILGALAMILFKLDLPHLGWFNLLLDFLNLCLFAWALGLVLLGLIFAFGTRIQALAWGVVFVFQPLCAAFFPVRILPPPIQVVATAIPATHVFEAARTNLIDTSTQWSEMGWALGLNVIYLTFGLWCFVRLLRRSQKSGQFAKNDI